MKKNSLIILLFVLFLSCIGQHQTGKKILSDKAATDVPEVINADIPGAPQLGKPMLIMGNERPVVAKGFGIAAPAFWDWDNDGKKDLLIGEFFSGMEHGHYVGNFLRVYKNVGDQSNPKFTDKFDYARAPYELLTNGTPLSIKQG